MGAFFRPNYDDNNHTDELINQSIRFLPTEYALRRSYRQHYYWQFVCVYHVSRIQMFTVDGTSPFPLPCSLFTERLFKLRNHRVQADYSVLCHVLYYGRK